jgi:glycosyltransferase involved in cell wall biosynthesis
MKVITLVDKPVPSERPTGIGVAAFNMALALSKRRIDVRYVCRGAVQETISLNDYLTVQTVRNYSRDNVRITLDVLRKDAPDVVHVHSTAALPSLFLGRVLGKAVAMHSHGDEPLHPIKLALMRKAGMILSQRVITVSEATRDDIIRTQRLSPKKIAVVYNGVSVEDFRPLPGPTHVMQKYGLEDAGKVLLSVGAVQQRKGQWMIIRCLPKILEKWPGLTYVNVGRAYDPSYQNQLLKEAERLGVSKNFRLLTGVPHDDLVALINSADVCVHPSSREAFGLAVAEEMACARPVVALDVDAMHEIIDDGVNGLLVQPSDQDNLTASILRLLGDPQLSKRIGEAARVKVVAKFTWDQAAAGLETLFREMLS